MEIERIEQFYKIHGRNKDEFYFSHIFRYPGAISQKEAIVVYGNDTSKYIDYINKYHIDKVIIEEGLESLEFLKFTPHIKYLWIRGNYDLEPLYYLTKINFLINASNKQLVIDNINGIEFLSTNPEYMFINNDVPSLKSLEVSGNIKGLNFLTKFNNLDTLVIHSTNIKSLSCIENLNYLKVLILINNKKLTNIDSLNGVKRSLKHLTIENCNYIKDYSIIGNLNELVYLSFNKMKYVPSIKFIKKLKKLHTFIFTYSNLLDGNMTSILELKHAVIVPIKKHFYKDDNGERKGIMDSDIPYGERVKGDEDIEFWRRTDY
jgi:hypothetical protein